MYLSTYEERENGSFYEEGYDGRNLSKLNLCENGKEAVSLLSHINPCPLTFHTWAYNHSILESSLNSAIDVRINLVPPYVMCSYFSL